MNKLEAEIGSYQLELQIWSEKEKIEFPEQLSLYEEGEIISGQRKKVKNFMFAAKEL